MKDVRDPDQELERLKAIVPRVTAPSDFNEFWTKTKEELAAVPLEWERVPDDSIPWHGMTVDWLKFTSLRGQSVYAWLAVPSKQDQSSQRGYLWLPGYSYGNPPPGPESLYPQTVTMGLNLHGNLPDTPYSHPSASNQEYITQGIKSQYTYIYRDIICHCLRALEVLAQQPEVNSTAVFVGGMSQGGGLALVTAALAPDKVSLCLADMPWLCDLDRALTLIDTRKYADGRRVPDGRYLIELYAQQNPEQRAQIFRTYRYFDPLTHAGQIQCPVQMSAGGRDPACRPATVYSVYNAIHTQKEMLYLPHIGHEIVPAMHTAHENWVKQWL